MGLNVVVSPACSELLSADRWSSMGFELRPARAEWSHRLNSVLLLRCRLAADDATTPTTSTRETETMSVSHATTTMTTTTTPTTTTPTTTTPTTTTRSMSCIDNPEGWTDSDGDCCATYVEHEWCTQDGQPGTRFNGTVEVVDMFTKDGRPALDSYCGCVVVDAAALTGSRQRPCASARGARPRRKAATLLAGRSGAPALSLRGMAGPPCVALVARRGQAPRCGGEAGDIHHGARPQLRLGCGIGFIGLRFRAPLLGPAKWPRCWAPL